MANTMQVNPQDFGPEDQRQDPVPPRRKGPPALPDPAVGSTGVEKQAQASARDISPLLNGWAYEPGSITVRQIVGDDGSTKLQMRLDLGLLQMEVTGRPDGTRPHGCESLLDYFEQKLEIHRQSSGSESGFKLNRRDCESLRHEAAMYYQRYLSLFVLEEFGGVVRDTDRNLRVLDLCGKYAADEQDRLWLEQYRPYILMMNARAKAGLLVKEGKHPEAYKVVRVALRRMKLFFERFNQPEAYAHSNEAKVLKRLARELKTKLPTDPVVELKKRLDKAVKAERYEEAAQLRDELARLAPDEAPGKGR